MTRRKFLQRTHRQQEREAKKGGFNPSNMIRLAGFGAALMVGVAVYIGFYKQGETIYSGPWGLLQRLITPLFLGINAMELLTVVIVGFLAWRIWLRMQSGK
jgi:hypothetical protein